MIRHMVSQDARPGRRADSLGCEEILDRDRDAVQGAAIVTRQDLTLGLSRLVPRLLGQQSDERVEGVVQGINSC
jgi:hypothetical protein